MSQNRLRPLLAAFAVLLSCAPAPAGEPTSPDPSDLVSSASETTYLDLLRQIVPDMTALGGTYSGRTIIDLRHAGGEDSAATPEDPITLGSLQAIPLAENRLLLLAELGPAEDAAQGIEPLALFDVSGAPKLLDAIDVGFDRFTSFTEPPVLDLGDDRLVLTASTHWNSNQSYVTTALLRVTGDRIEPIDTLFTLSDSACAFERRQVPTVTPVPGSDAAHPDISVHVTETITPREEDCGEEAKVSGSTREIPATYRWDAAAGAYRPDSDALSRLEEENFDRL